MLNHIRLMFVALFLSLFLVACGDDNTQQDASSEAPEASSEMSSGSSDSSEDTASETASEAEATPADDSSSVIGMTEEEVIAKWGKPDLTQTRTIDALTVTHHEWHREDGITAVQFQNGVAKFSQFVPAE